MKPLTQALKRGTMVPCWNDDFFAALSDETIATLLNDPHWAFERPRLLAEQVKRA